jgi:hypothetical protein
MLPRVLVFWLVAFIDYSLALIYIYKHKIFIFWGLCIKNLHIFYVFPEEMMSEALENFICPQRSFYYLPLFRHSFESGYKKHASRFAIRYEYAACIMFHMYMNMAHICIYVLSPVINMLVASHFMNKISLYYALWWICIYSYSCLYIHNWR